MLWRTQVLQASKYLCVCLCLSLLSVFWLIFFPSVCISGQVLQQLYDLWLMRPFLSWLVVYFKEPQNKLLVHKRLENADLMSSATNKSTTEILKDSFCTCRLWIFERHFGHRLQQLCNNLSKTITPIHRKYLVFCYSNMKNPLFSFHRISVRVSASYSTPWWPLGQCWNPNPCDLSI